MAGDDSVLTPALKAQWDEHGFCVIERAIPADVIAGAQDAMSRVFPTAEEMESGADDEFNIRWKTWDAQWPEFPFHSSRLNNLVLHPTVIDVAERLLEHRDLALYMGTMTAKYSFQSSGFNQLLHTDYPNHMIVVPRRDVGYQQVELFVYLTDVTLEDGATRMVSWQKTRGIPVERHTLNYIDYADLYDDPGHTAAPAGSIVAYRPDVYHRSVDVDEPGHRRVMLHVSFKPRQAEWGGYSAWAFKGLKPEWSKFVQQANLRQLTLLGVPEPGHPYWTEDTLAGFAARYPGLDVAPWREGLHGVG
ncbi:MAG TPA: phytanoyl-CoA dioxygenase family protein [Acidimicrobiales bacterium]|nr:phytanoyl-CoA dioxygenase family protein [Acidimicrobiales bacterium]